MDSYQLHQISRQIGSSNDIPIYLRAIKGVLSNAQDGELPLFAWTMGLRQTALIQMLKTCFPEVRIAEPLPEHQYRKLLETVPDDVITLKNLLFTLRSPNESTEQVDWLARAIAVATQGSRHLWQDLGLNSRDEVSQLLQRYFEPLHRQNTENWKWKRFIYGQLGASQGKPELQPPKCMKCSEFAVCFPFSRKN